MNSHYSTQYPITSVCRCDVIHMYRTKLNFSKEIAEQRANNLSDAEMVEIADMMRNDYLEQLFWGSLEQSMQILLDNKEIP